MNKVMFIGRLTKDPEVKYSNAAEPMAIANFSLAVSRAFKKEGQPEADFFNCVAFGKKGEVIEKYCKKGDQIGVECRAVVESWEHEGTKRYATKFIVEQLTFCGKSGEGAGKTKTTSTEGFYPIDENIEMDDLPF